VDSPWLRALALLTATNTAPVVASWLLRARARWPLDGGLVLGDGQRLLGANKTWRGLAAAVLVGALIGPWLGLDRGQGALGGLLTILGDALSSFVKRRLRLPPSTWLPGLDQLPEAALPLLVLWRPLGLDLLAFTAAIAAFAGLDLVGSRLLGSSRRAPKP
jgi:CDP-diglyceride synthetase